MTTYGTGQVQWMDNGRHLHVQVNITDTQPGVLPSSWAVSFPRAGSSFIQAQCQGPKEACLISKAQPCKMGAGTRCTDHLEALQFHCSSFDLFVHCQHSIPALSCVPSIFLRYDNPILAEVLILCQNSQLLVCAVASERDIEYLLRPHEISRERLCPAAM